MRLSWLLCLGLLLGLAGCAEFDYGGGRSPGPSSSPAPSSGASGEPRASYVVERGDTLYSIAWGQGLDFREVGRWNGIEPPYRIYPGQRLRLRPPPGGVSASPEGARQAQKASPRPEDKPQVASGSAPSASSTTGSEGDSQPTRPPSSDDDGAESAAQRDRSSGGEPNWRWPADGDVVERFNAGSTGKRGIRIRGDAGATVRAAGSGRVVYSGDGLRGYGNLVIIKHDSRYLTAYGYNSRLLVAEGEQVSAGQPIARMGTVPGGEEVALHFEVRRDGTPTDPLARLPRR